MVKAWVTGIGGFLGSHLAQALMDDGYEVCGNDNLICGSIENIPEGICWKGTDCCDFVGMSAHLNKFKPDVLIHCAATAAEGFSVFSPHFITRNIAEASVATFSAAIASGVKRIVYMSSMSRYGKGEPPFKESDATNPLDPYAISKVYAETQLKMLCETHGVKWSILVPHNIIGPKQEISAYRNVVSIFLNRLKQNMPVYIYGDGEQKRSFSPVKDCIQSIKKVVEGAADGEIINIGPDDNEISINTLLDICEEIAGVKADRVYLPPRPITDTVKEAYCSADKAREMLGYKSEQDIFPCIKEMSAAMTPKEFDYSFPIEINNEQTPRTWREKL